MHACTYVDCFIKVKQIKRKEQTQQYFKYAQRMQMIVLDLDRGKAAFFMIRSAASHKALMK